jgi:hypothetical protein
MRPLGFHPDKKEKLLATIRESTEESVGMHRGRTVTPTEGAASGENTTQHRGFDTDRNETDEDERMASGDNATTLESVSEKPSSEVEIEAESGATAGNGVVTPETRNNAKRHASRSAVSGERPRTTNRQRTQEPSPRDISTIFDSTLECPSQDEGLDGSLQNSHAKELMDISVALKIMARRMAATDRDHNKQLEDLKGQLKEKDAQLQIKDEEMEVLKAEKASLEKQLSGALLAQHDAERKLMQAFQAHSKEHKH